MYDATCWTVCSPRAKLVEYLHSEGNTGWLDRKQEMTAPLSHYYISTSHNT